MARIRNIKPGFFKDSDLYDAEKASGLPLRVAYAGLWTVADRAGRFKWKPREIKTDILPYDDVDMGAVMDALVRYGFIFKYKAAGHDYGYVPNFEKHQFINKNELASQLPDPAQNIILDSVPNPASKPSQSAPENYQVLLDTDTDGLTQTQVLENAPQAAPSKPNQGKGTRWPADQEVPEDWVREVETKFQQLGRAPPDFRVEAVKFANHWSSKTGKDGTKLDWKRTFENWCLNARPEQRSFAEQRLNNLKTGARRSAFVDGQRGEGVESPPSNLVRLALPAGNG